MKIIARALVLVLASLGAARALLPQDLTPREFIITPISSNAVILTYSYFYGNVVFDGAVPITGARATVNVPIFSYYHSLNFFGRSANISVAVPYGIGSFNGTVAGVPRYGYRSGLRDSFVRFAVNLKGGPAMKAREFMTWRQKVLLGASLKVVAPTGQYNPTRVVNWGNNRWAFKPEFGYSERWNHVVLDGYAAAWFFTSDPEYFSKNPFFPGVRSQSEAPVAAFETHLSYDFKPRFWVSLDGNFWFGGKTSLNGQQNPLTEQRSSRVGATASIPLTKHQSLKVSYSNGAYVSYGGNYQNVSIGWQYSWLGWSLR
jgi:Putative MetA-pathway of phenol degradation